MHCESLISLLDIHVIENRCGRIDNRIGTRGSDHHTLHRSIAGLELQMFANVMTYIDRTAMSLMVVLAATPILGIAAQAAFL